MYPDELDRLYDDLDSKLKDADTEDKNKWIDLTGASVDEIVVSLGLPPTTQSTDKSPVTEEELRQIVERSVPAHPFSNVLIDTESYREQSQPTTQSATEGLLEGAVNRTIEQAKKSLEDTKLLDFLDSLPVPEDCGWQFHLLAHSRRSVIIDWVDNNLPSYPTAREAIYNAMVEAERSKS